MIRRTLAIVLFLAAALAGPAVHACGGMSHDNEGGGQAPATSAPAPAAKQPGGAALEQLLAPYLLIRASLSNDSVADVAAQAQVFTVALKSAAPGAKDGKAANTNKLKSHKLAKKGFKILKKIPCAGHAAMMIEDTLFTDDKPSGAGTFEKLQQAAQKLTGDKSGLQETRNNFAAMSDAFVSYLKENNVSLDAEGVQLFYCPMANHYWLQRGGEPAGNPFFGSKMPDCGENRPLSSLDNTAASESSSDSGHKHN